MALGWEGWATLAVLLLGLAVMATDRLGPDFVFMAMLGVLLAAQIITLGEGLAGFANSGLLTVMVLFPVAEGIARTGGLDSMFSRLLGRPSTVIMAQVRMMLPVTILSGFLNNTPIVALLVPLIFTWAQGSNGAIHPQKLLIPLSFASLLGGTCTLIGTSTNLVVAGLQAKQAVTNPEVPVFGMFDLTAYGFPYAVFGVLYIVLFSPWLLPPTSSVGCMKRKQESNDEELLVGLKVDRYSHVVGKTIEDAGLRHLDKLFIVSVERGGYPIPAVGPDFVLAAEDVVFFTGDLKGIPALAASHKLHYVTDENEDDEALTGSPRRFLGSPGPGQSEPALTLDIEQYAPISNQDGSPSAARELHMICGDADSSDHSSDPLDVEAQTEFHVDLPLEDGVAEKSHHIIPGLSIVGSPQRHENSTKVEPTNLHHSKPSTLLRAELRDDSELITHSIRQVGFRGKLNASVVAVIRGGQRVPGKLGDIMLEGGDILLLDAANNFDVRAEIVKSNFSKVDAVTDEIREFMAPMVVPETSHLLGKTIQEAELRGLPGLFLVAIDRADGETLHAVAPDTVLKVGDVLWFSGDLDAIASLRKVAGLKHQEGHHSDKLGIQAIHRRLVQAVVASNGPLIGKSIKSAAFRTTYGAAIIAVHRQGERLRQKIGDIVLHAGDVLLVDTGPGFVEKFAYDKSFALIAEVENSHPTNTSRMWVAAGLGFAMVMTQIIAVFVGNFIELFTAALLAAAGMLATGCLTGAQARKSLKWDIFIAIGAAFGVSIAMEKTGLATTLANLLVSAASAMGGSATLLVAIYIATALLSNIIANNAAAAIMFPISFKVATELGIDFNIMSVALMLGASSCYATPFGYQTNLMVFGAGGYRTMDFVRFGGPLQLWLAIGFALIVYFELADRLWVLQIVSSIMALLIIAYPFVISWRAGGSRRPRAKQTSHAV